MGLRDPGDRWCRVSKIERAPLVLEPVPDSDPEKKFQRNLNLYRSHPSWVPNVWAEKAHEPV